MPRTSPNILERAQVYYETASLDALKTAHTFLSAILKRRLAAEAPPAPAPVKKRRTRGPNKPKAATAQLPDTRPAAEVAAVQGKLGTAPANTATPLGQKRGKRPSPEAAALPEQGVPAGEDV